MTTPKLAYQEVQSSLEGAVQHGFVKARLSRSRFLRWCGAGLFGTAVTLFLPVPAAEAALAPCYGYPLCVGGCCRSDLVNCDPHCAAGYLGCPSGGACWYVCSGGTRYRCCDCKCSGCSACICKYVVGTC